VKWSAFVNLMLLVLFLGLALTGCRSSSQAPDVDMTLEMEPTPLVVGPSGLLITLSDSNGSPLDGATVKAEASMPDREGMNPLKVSLRSGENGEYEAPFSWTMEGKWVMDVTATLPDGGQITHSFDVSVHEEGEHTHDDQMEMDMNPNRVPNEGAMIQLLSPKDGTLVGVGDEVIVQIATENFELAEEGNHWHIYVDGHSYRMIMGGMTEAILSDLSPGQHEISVYLSVGTHEELEDGATIGITVADGSEGD
jgi:hypothetical protein